MNKKFLSAILFGALMVTSTGTFVSCKDYDDDIDRIDQELTDIKSAIAALQSKVDGGKYVTNVAKNGDGITVTWSDNSTSTIETIKGDKGDKTIVTIVDGYWAFDGVKSEYPAQGEAAAAGHDAKISDNGYWMVWDATKGAYVETEYIAGGVVAVKVDGGWGLTVRDKNGETQTITIPGSAALLSITPELNGQNYAQNFNIYYGILNEDVDWKGHKAVNGKMLKGMYPTADRDIKMQLNPSNVDANDYDWAFVSTDNTTPWGLSFGAPQVWTGKATTATRSVTSANGLWSLPRDVQKFDLNSEAIQGRPDYVTQFKSNDGERYLFALQGTSKIEGVSVKSDYVYTFKASNVNATEDITLPSLTFSPSNKSFLYGREYAPTFDMWSSYDGYDQWAEDSVLVYDYYLEIDKSKITDESIRKYGVAITEDGYRFIAKNEAVVNNTIPFVYNYILINGKKGSVKFSVNFNDEEAVVSNQYIGDYTAPFNATVIADQTRWYALNYTFSLDKFFEGLGESGKMKWIDAIARSWNGLTTDPQEIRKGIFKKKYNSSVTEYAVELTGGDPINNQGGWDVIAYNGTLLDKYIEFDYVDKDGKSCLTGNIRDLDKIVGLKVTFLVDSELGHVTAPYYTTTGDQYNDNPNIVALPLNNAFRVEIATRYDQYEVARMNFTFELQMPTNCPIKRESVANRTSAWSQDKDGNDVLTVYGEKLFTEGDDAPLATGGFVAADLRDAFQGVYKYQNGAYNDKPNVEGEWYELTVPENRGEIIGESSEAVVNLADISPSSLYTEWNTIDHYLTDGAFNTYTLTDVKYHHFNVYTEELDDIILTFASRVADATTAKVASKGTKENPFTAKAIYSTDGTQTIVNYAFEVTNADFTLADAFDKPFYLFDQKADADKKIEAKLRAELNFSLVSNRQSIVVDKADPSFYGLYPSAKMDEQATNVVTYILDGANPTDNTNKMKFEIAKEVGNGKVIEITYHITDVFGAVKELKFYVQTLN